MHCVEASCMERPNTIDLDSLSSISRGHHYSYPHALLYFIPENRRVEIGGEREARRGSVEEIGVINNDAEDIPGVVAVRKAVPLAGRVESDCP